MSIGVDYTTWQTFLISLKTSPRVPVINRTSTVCSISICFLSLSSTTFLSSLRSVGRTFLQVSIEPALRRTNGRTDGHTCGEQYIPMLRIMTETSDTIHIKHVHTMVLIVWQQHFLVASCCLIIFYLSNVVLIIAMQIEEKMTYCDNKRETIPKTNVYRLFRSRHLYDIIVLVSIIAYL